MQLSLGETDALREILHALSEESTATSLRQNVGESLMRLLKADYLASYIWHDSTSKYDSGIAVNMDPANLERYEQYFQFHDPVTPRMAVLRHATLVDEVIDRDDLYTSEFYCDFLARDGLHHGLNFFAHDGSRQLGDIRLWRGRTRESFDENDRAVLELVGRVLTTRLAHIERMRSTEALADLLTPREREIASALRAGLGDAAIARQMFLSPATVRSHVNHLFQKLGVRSRLEAVAVLGAEFN